MAPELRLPRLLALAGSSESGKSTAGEYLSTLNIRRLKIRPLLQRLRSGECAQIGGAPTRINFEWTEFLELLTAELGERTGPIVLLESFIDPELALFFKTRWPSPVTVIYIDAPEETRARRFARQLGIWSEDPLPKLRQKDASKGLPGTLSKWREMADFVVINDQTLAEFKEKLFSILELIE